MKKTMNTDFWGAGILFLFAGGFYSQMDPDFTHYAAFFPNHLIPCLIILGVALLIKGFVKPTRLPAFYSEFNATLIFTMITGLIWALLRGFKFKVQHPVLGYWRLLKKLHRVS